MSLEIILLGTFHLFLMLALLLYTKIKGGYKVLSPETLYILFSFFHIFYVFYFGFNIQELEGFIGSDFEGSKESVYTVLIAKIAIDITYIFVSFNVRRFGYFGRILSVFFKRDSTQGGGKLFPFFLLLFGVFLLLKLFAELGGFYYYWENIHLRTSLLAGHGGLLSLSRNILQIAIFLLSVYYISSGKKLMAAFYLLCGAVLLTLLGSRSSFIFLIFTFILYCYSFLYVFKVNLKLIAIFLGFTLIFTAVGIVRTQQIDEGRGVVDVINSIAPYASGLRRDVTILEYFDERDFWLGEQYYSLLTAPIPRSFYEAKPVIDGGRYVVAMHQGFEVPPHAEVHQLPDYGWPEGNMAGYMNFGWIGLFFFTVLSAIFVKIAYVTVLKTRNLYIFFIYSYMVFMVPITFDPYGVFKFMTYVVVVMLVMFLSKIFLSFLSLGVAKK